MNKGIKNSPTIVKIIEPIAAKNNTSNSLYPNSIRKIDALRIEIIQIKYPNLENANCISQLKLLMLNCHLVLAQMPFYDLESCIYGSQIFFDQ